jgi:hypothetical protein
MQIILDEIDTLMHQQSIEVFDDRDVVDGLVSQLPLSWILDPEETLQIARTIYTSDDPSSQMSVNLDGIGMMRKNIA